MSESPTEHEKTELTEKEKAERYDQIVKMLKQFGLNYIPLELPGKVLDWRNLALELSEMYLNSPPGDKPMSDHYTSDKPVPQQNQPATSEKQQPGKPTADVRTPIASTESPQPTFENSFIKPFRTDSQLTVNKTQYRLLGFICDTVSEIPELENISEYESPETPQIPWHKFADNDTIIFKAENVETKQIVAIKLEIWSKASLRALARIYSGKRDGIPLEHYAPLEDEISDLLRSGLDYDFAQTKISQAPELYESGMVSLRQGLKANYLVFYPNQSEEWQKAREELFITMKNLAHYSIMEWVGGNYQPIRDQDEWHEAADAITSDIMRQGFGPYKIEIFRDEAGQIKIIDLQRTRPLPERKDLWGELFQYVADFFGISLSDLTAKDPEFSKSIKSSKI